MYDEGFYDKRFEASIRSARAIVPWVMELLTPTSVIDVGCANGIWLSVFAENGVETIRGIDGPWVKSEQLLIPEESFSRRDLDEAISEPRSFDLATSVEVAEHLQPERALSFIRDLTRLSKCVLFSAAIPKQGGTGHINERWQSYWAELFRENGHLAIDCIRPRVWSNPDVNVVHAQNMILFAEEAVIDRNAKLRTLRDSTTDTQLSLVHPVFFEKALLRAQKKTLAQRLKKKISKLTR